MITNVWEVYKRDTQQVVMFKTEELAINQDIFSEADLIGKARVWLSDEEMEDLNNGKPVFD